MFIVPDMRIHSSISCVNDELVRDARWRTGDDTVMMLQEITSCALDNPWCSLFTNNQGTVLR